jgi:hypothetical protein
MRAINFRDAYEFDPESYVEGGGLPGLLKRVMQQQSVQQQGADFGSTPNNSPEYNPDSFSSPQGGLLGRLRSLQAEQSQYQPISGTNERVPSLPQDPNFRQLSRLPNGAPSLTPSSSVSPAPPSQSIQQFEADQAQQAREAAAARMARGVRSVARAEAPPLDPIDIGKSAGIGVVNGVIGTIGMAGDALTGFGHFPKNVVPNMWRLSNDLPPLPDDAPDYFKSWGADSWRHSLENHVGELYQPKTEAGRYAETIGEMVPALVGGEALAAVRGVAKVGTVLRQLPATLFKHAVVPGIGVHAVQEAYPESHAGQILQKGYPVVRRGLPLALAIQRYLGR